MITTDEDVCNASSFYRLLIAVIPGAVQPEANISIIDSHSVTIGTQAATENLTVTIATQAAAEILTVTIATQAAAENLTVTIATQAAAEILRVTIGLSN